MYDDKDKFEKTKKGVEEATRKNVELKVEL